MKIGHLGLSLRDRPGFIQHNKIRLSGGLQCCGGFEQHTLLSPHSAADHNRDGRCEPQRTRAADNEHTDRARQRKAEGFSHNEPDDSCNQSDANHNRHKDAGYPICHFCNRRFCRRGILHHFNNLAQGRIAADAGGGAGEGAVLVQGCRTDQTAGRFIHRKALAGERCLVDRALPFQHPPVNRDAFTGAHKKGIANAHLFHRDRRLPLIPQHMRRFRGQIYQAFDRIRRFALAVCLQHFSNRDKR